MSLRLALAGLVAAGCGGARTGACHDPLIVSGWAEPGTRVELRRSRSDVLVAHDRADATGYVVLEARTGGAPLDVYAVAAERKLGFDGPLCRGLDDVSFR